MANYKYIFLLFFTLSFTANAVGENFILGDLEQDVKYSYLENKGQYPSQVIFSTHLSEGQLFFEKNKFTFHLYDVSKLHDVMLDSLTKPSDSEMINHHSFDISFLNANENVAVSGNSPKLYMTNFFIGNDYDNWVTNAKSYDQLYYSNIYNNIDLVVNNVNLKYDFIVKPKADISLIKLKINGASSVTSNLQNELIIETTINNLIKGRPIVYQTINNERIYINAKYHLVNNVVTFELLDSYNDNYALIIDPELIFATYSGSTGLVSADASTYDSEGNIYVSGGTFSAGYPTTTGAYQESVVSSGFSMGVQKISADGTNLLFATYLSGSNGNDYPLSMIADDNDNLYLLSTSEANDFPIVNGANTTYGQGRDYVVSLLSSNGSSLLSSTYLGGSGEEGAYTSRMPCAIYFNQNKVYVVGTSDSDDLPSKLNDISGNTDAFLSCLTPNLSVVEWTRYFGGTQEDVGTDVKIAEDGSVYVTGYTYSADFPTLNNAYQVGYKNDADGFIVKLSADGLNVINSTFVGSEEIDKVKFIQLSSKGDVYILGATNGNYPVYNTSFSNSGDISYFIHALDADLENQIFSTSIGCEGTLRDISRAFSPSAFGLDECDNIYFTGVVSGDGFPISNDAFESNRKGLYMAVLSSGASGLKYGSYFGSTSGSHYHQASNNKYDKNGVLYHTECTVGDDYPVSTNAYSDKMTFMNDAATFKFDFNFQDFLVEDNYQEKEIVNYCGQFDSIYLAHSFDNVNYLWSTGENTKNILPSSSGKYTVEIFNECSIIYDTMYVHLKTDSVNVFKINEKCNNAEGSIILTYDSLRFNEPTIKWEDDALANFTRNNLQSGTYSLVIDESICVDTMFIDIIDSAKLEIDSIVKQDNICFGDSLGTIKVYSDVSILDSLIFNWSHDTLLKSNTAELLPNGNYQLNITNTDLCSATYDVVINSNAAINISSTSKDDHCNDSIGELNYQVVSAFNMNQLNFSLNGIASDGLAFKNLSKGVYVFEIEDLNGCLYEKRDTIVQKSSIPLKLISENFCFDDSTFLRIEPLDSNIILNQAVFLIDGINFSGETSIKHKFDKVGNNQIKIIAASKKGCIDSINQEVVIYPKPKPMFTDSIEICGFQTLQLNNVSVGADHLSWFLNGEKISQEVNPNVEFNKYGTNSVKLITSNDFGCLDSFYREKAVMVNPLPRLNISLSDEYLVFPKNTLEVTLTETSDSNMYYIDGDELLSKTLTFSNSGEYEICSRVISNKNCETSECQSIYVYDKPQILVPNAFTPNQDGVNDFFEIKNININEFKIEIFDRWGQSVFLSSDVNFQWNGEVNIESKSKNDTYFYKIEYVDIFNVKSFKEGTITILK